MRGIWNAVAILLLAAIAVVILLAVALGLGWLLSAILPLSLFEGSALAMMALMFVGALTFVLLGTLPPGRVEQGISASRFAPSEEDRTWANWLRYTLADAIYVNVWEHVPPEARSEQYSERLDKIAVTLADAAVTRVRDKVRRGQRLRINQEVLSEALGPMAHKEGTDEILEIATAAVNGRLAELDEIVKEINRHGRWDELTVEADPWVIG